ncbi:MAG TPA: hypothetical protein VKS81_08950 [Bacteroidota bacterium]|nr:hypothetical protein [Bacteroidota bacterium]
MLFVAVSLTLATRNIEIACPNDVVKQAALATLLTGLLATTSY